MKRSADVVIVGGGCMGASVAYHLGRRGVTDVVLIEREKLLGSGSTGRNAGGVRHQFSHAANIRLSLESIALLERFEDEVGCPIDFHQDGYLFLLSTPSSVETFKQNVALQRSLGVDVAWLSGDDAARLAPGLSVDGVIGATFCQRDGIADPNGVTMGFAKAAQAMGATVERDTEVTGVIIDRGRVAGVETTRGAIAQPPAGAVVPASKIMVIDFETTFYFHREGAGVLFGMGDPTEPSTFDTTVRWDFLEQATGVAMARLPALADASISHAWAGLYEMTPDANPIIGPVRDVPGFFLINGFSGHGFQHSPAAGRILADLIVSADPEMDLAPFALERLAAAARPGERYVV
jgi:sarcosine oxidase subunit beta